MTSDTVFINVCFAEDDWYLCHVTILSPKEELLTWGMYPYPYLARVDPDARKGTVIYQLAAYCTNKENSSTAITYALIAGKSFFEHLESLHDCERGFFSYPILSCS